MPLTQADVDKVVQGVLAKLPLAVNGYRNADADAASVKAGHGHIPDVYGYTVDTNAKVNKLAMGGVDLDALAAKVAANPALATAIAEQVAEKLAARLAN